MQVSAEAIGFALGKLYRLHEMQLCFYGGEDLPVSDMLGASLISYYVNEWHDITTTTDDMVADRIEAAVAHGV